MILQVNSKKDKFTEKIYNESMEELEGFFQISWKINTPVLILTSDRKIFDNIYKRKTEKWLVACNTGSAIFILDRKNFEKESSHKYSDDNYKKLIKHELCHSFCEVLSNKNYKPIWFSEGVALFVAEQINDKIPPKKFSNFLEFYDKQGSKMYDESGFVIALLLKKFGKEKLIHLIKSLKKAHSEKDFAREFKKIYKFNLNYKNINNLYKKCQLQQYN